MLMFFGSVPSSGRPAFETTAFTSGKLPTRARSLRISDLASWTETEGGSVMLIQIEPSFSSGRNSVPRKGISDSAPVIASRPETSTTHVCASAHLSAGSYQRWKRRIRKFSSCGMFLVSSTLLNRGTSVNDAISATISAETTEYAIGAKILPSCRCMVKIGRCATMMMTMENPVGRPTSVTASRMTRTRVLTSLISAAPRRRKMFSMTITAPSTMMPKSIAPSDSRLAGIFITVSPRKVPSRASGMMIETIAAARALPRNR